MIRELTKSDIAKVNTIGRELYNNFDKIYDIDSYLNNSNYFMYVLEEEEIIAFLIATNNIDYYELLCIVVSDNNRNAGNGSKLMKYFINLINKPIILEVSDKNMVAINLYKKLGFKKIGFRENYYADSNAIIMKLVI